MNIGARTGCWAKSGYTARDYVQTNLTNILDGIENRGYGVAHDSESTAWIDCITGVSNAFSKGENAYFGTDHWHRNSALGQFACRFPSPFEESTYEVVVRLSFTTTQRILGNGSAARFELDCGNGVMRLYLMRKSGSPYTYSTGVNVQSDELFTTSLTIDSDGVVSIYKNGKFRNVVSTVHQLGYYSGNNLQLGSWSGTSSAIIADYFCVRRYKGVLTAAEIAANYAIDKARFGLT